MIKEVNKACEKLNDTLGIHVYFQWLLQDCHTLCGYQRMA